jgi:hypothetical protein
LIKIKRVLIQSYYELLRNEKKKFGKKYSVFKNSFPLI